MSGAVGYRGDKERLAEKAGGAGDAEACERGAPEIAGGAGCGVMGMEVR